METVSIFLASHAIVDVLPYDKRVFGSGLTRFPLDDGRQFTNPTYMIEIKFPVFLLTDRSIPYLLFVPTGSKIVDLDGNVLPKFSVQAPGLTNGYFAFPGTYRVVATFDSLERHTQMTESGLIVTFRSSLGEVPFRLI